MKTRHDDEETDTDEQKDESKKSFFGVSTGIVSMYLTGRLLNAFVPYIGVAIVIATLAWAIKLVIGNSQQ